MDSMGFTENYWWQYNQTKMQERTIAPKFGLPLEAQNRKKTYASQTYKEIAQDDTGVKRRKTQLE